MGNVLIPLPAPRRFDLNAEPSGLHVYSVCLLNTEMLSHARYLIYKGSNAVFR